MGTTAIVVLHECDLHFQGKTFIRYAFLKKNAKSEAGHRQICLELHFPAVELLLLIV